VEDEEDLAETVSEQLQLLGYEVISVNSAEDALATLDERPDIQLLFTDLIMSGKMNGNELIEETRKKFPQVKHLLTSGHVMQQTKNTILLQKPYTLKELSKTIRTLLDSPSNVKVFFSH
jgi:CheY-like chemotaxis protein